MSASRTVERLKIYSSKVEKDLCFARFFELFPTAEDCERVIFQVLAANGVPCECGSTLTDWKPGVRTAKCSACRRPISVTAKTFFHGMRLPSAYLSAIFVTGEGLGISGNDFSERLGISQSQGAAILDEVSAAVVREMDNAIELLSAFMLDAVAKRSKETPALKHPKSEQVEAEKRFGKDASVSNGDAELPTGVLERQIYELLLFQSLAPDDLSQRTNRSISEVLSAITMLELFGFARVAPGNRIEAIERYGALQSEQSSGVSAAVRDEELKLFFTFVARTYHAVSRKYLQRYYARYWCFIDRKTWQFESLLALCARSPFQSRAQLASYVTPLSVKVVLRKNC